MAPFDEDDSSSNLEETVGEAVGTILAGYHISLCVGGGSSMPNFSESKGGEARSWPSAGTAFSLLDVILRVPACTT